MNTNTQSQNTVSLTIPAETPSMPWPFDTATWPVLAEPVYRSMPREARFALGRTLRERAANKGELSPAQHVLYALLKGKNPFRAFSPVRTPAQLGSGQLAWGGLLNAISGAEHDLSVLEAAGTGDCTLLAKLRQLLLMSRLRALGLSIMLVPRQHRARRQYLLDLAMNLTPQGTGTVQSHCVATHESFLRILAHLEGRSALKLPVPAWVEAFRQPLLGAASCNRALMRDYLTTHDCGKPFCLSFDETGRAHFPGHASISARVWLELGGTLRVASLIAQDMDLHTLKPEDVEAFAERPDSELLLLSGVASLHANADDFGGASSDSFKIKMKRLTSRGARVADHRFRQTAA
jgi:hypothetical protein